MKCVLRKISSFHQYFLWRRNEDNPKLECCSSREAGSADNLSEFEVIVEAATDNKKKKLKCSDNIIGNHHCHKNS